MVTSPGDNIEAQAAGSKDMKSLPKPKPSWTTQIDTEQVFRLIDSILPFEACLYHQILPLSLEGSRLKLGMVNLDDIPALDYVRRILAYMNCSLVPQTLATDVHHAALSAYLSYTGSKKQTASSPAESSHAIEKRPKQRFVYNGITNSGTAKTDGNVTDAHPAQPDQNSNPTLLVDSPESLNFFDLDITDPEAPPPPSTPSPAVDAAIAVEQPLDTTDSALAPPPNGLDPLRETLILASDTVTAVSPPPEIPTPGDALPELSVEPQHLADPVEVLATLPPTKLLEELLGRLLIGGIGRLYFERQLHHGRILWSQNGVLQSVLEELSVDTIQGIINELKLLTHLPLIAVQKPKQVEIERLYQKHRLLLRLRVMPGTHGEEATVQVLRGAALKFYQQQQLASLSRDALTIAQELQHKVNEIRVRTRFYPLLSPDQLSILPALDQVLKSVEQQLEDLKALQLAEIENTEGQP